MKSFEIFFLNNGAAQFQTASYCHVYEDMKQLALDFKEYQDNGDEGWEGNEPEYREEYDYEIERNGGYYCITENTMDDGKKKEGWRNVEKFFSAL